MNIFLTFLNSLLYCFAAAWFWKKTKCINVGLTILILWTISALFAIYYCQTGMHVWRRDFTLFPFVYLFVLFLISIFPFLKLNEWKINTITTNKKVIDKFAIAIGVIAIIPFLENFFQVFHTVQSGGNEMMEMFKSRYTDDKFDQYYYMSGIGKKLLWINNNFAIVANCLLLYYVSFSKINKKIICGLLISIVTIYLAAYNTGARYIIIKNLLLLLFYILVFFRFIDEKKKKILMKYSLIVVGSFVSMTVAISIYRFTDMQDSVSYSLFDWLSWYLSEGFLNFNGDMWYIDKYLWGRNTMFLERYMFAITDHIEGRDFQSFESLLRITMNIFYTMIGDFYADFGPWLTPVVFISISAVFYVLCKSKRNMPLSRLVLLGVWAKACMIGFTYYTYHGDEYQTILTPLIFLMLVFFEKQSNKIVLVNKNVKFKSFSRNCIIQS